MIQSLSREKKVHVSCRRPKTLTTYDESLFPDGISQNEQEIFSTSSSSYMSQRCFVRDWSETQDVVSSPRTMPSRGELAHTHTHTHTTNAIIIHDVWGSDIERRCVISPSCRLFSRRCLVNYVSTRECHRTTTFIELIRKYHRLTCSHLSFVRWKQMRQFISFRLTSHLFVESICHRRHGKWQTTISATSMSMSYTSNVSTYVHETPVVTTIATTTSSTDINK
jgi:hypothetical protein